MSIAIRYFTATGNTMYAAKRLRDRLEAGSLSRVSALSAPGVEESADTLALLFPVHLHRPPQAMIEFARRMKAREGARIVAVATDNGDSGDCFAYLGKVLRAAGHRLHAGYSILAPGTSIIKIDLMGSAEEAERRLAAIDATIDRVALSIAAGDRVLPSGGSFASNLLARYLRCYLPRYDVGAKLWENARCVGCGVCVKICPARNIELIEGRPRRGGTCCACLACFHLCPAEAVELDDYSAGKRRYRNPDIRIDELYLA